MGNYLQSPSQHLPKRVGMSIDRGNIYFFDVGFFWCDQVPHASIEDDKMGVSQLRSKHTALKKEKRNEVVDILKSLPVWQHGLPHIQARFTAIQNSIFEFAHSLYSCIKVNSHINTVSEHKH